MHSTILTRLYTDSDMFTGKCQGFFPLKTYLHKGKRRPFQMSLTGNTLGVRLFRETEG